MRAACCEQIGKPLVLKEFPVPEIEPHDILVKVAGCGVCHSDLHLVDGDWADWDTPFPIIPGHEITGVVEEVGEQVDGIEIGERVGVPWMQWTCGHCRDCRRGEEVLCSNQIATGVDVNGGYAEYVKAPANYAAKIPEGLDLIETAPLFCAGITVFSPLYRYGSLAGARVCVLGMGGLGHLAVMFAKALGAEVIATSRSSEKLEQAEGFGARYTIQTDRADIKDALQDLGGADLILATAIDGALIQQSVEGLAKGGRMVILAAVSDPLTVDPFFLLSGHRSVAGSPIGSRRELRAMLECAAVHDIVPVVESFPLEEAEAVLQRLRNDQVRFRAVLVP